jgi:hypothetical protein
MRIAVASLASALIAGCASAIAPGLARRGPDGRQSTCAARAASRRECHELRRIARTASVPSNLKQLLRFSAATYNLEIGNAGETHPFTLWFQDSYTARVEADSAAMVVSAAPSMPRPISAADRRSWMAAESHKVRTSRAKHTDVVILAPDKYAFTPFGRLLTVADVRRLGNKTSQVKKQLTNDVAVRFPEPAAGQMLEEYGYLLAVAPLKKRTRRAMLRALVALKGGRLCGPQNPVIHSAKADHLIEMCGTAGVVCDISEQLSERSSIYPFLKSGALIESTQFRLGRSGYGCPALQARDHASSLPAKGARVARRRARVEAKSQG